MATLKDILKSYFSSGKKPTQQQFHELIDSYIHKTEDGLTLSEEGNLGVGVETPDARLHIDGGLKIGDALEDAAEVPQGTLRWTGTKLQISFAGKWEDVWSGERNNFKTIAQSYPLANKPVSTVAVVTAGPFNFPARSVQLLRIGFTYDYVKSRSVSSAFGTFKNNKDLSITVIAASGATLFTKTIKIDEGSRNNVDTGLFDVTGNRSIENVASFSIRFSITSNTGLGSLTATMKQASISCLAKV